MLDENLRRSYQFSGLIWNEHYVLIDFTKYLVTLTKNSTAKWLLLLLIRIDY